MHSVWKTSIRFTLIATVLLGLGYPLVVTAIAGLLFPHKAAGSLIQLQDGTVIGSELLAQSFTSDRYFHPRPSAAGNGYDATSSSGSNLASTSKSLIDRVQASVTTTQNTSKTPVPVDLVTASASGLDPDLTPDAAVYQIPRVAKARNLTEPQVQKLVEQHITARQFGVLGEPRVNVLALNRDLDKLGK